MIRPDETLLEGQWLSERACTIRDATCDRISLLTQNWLKRLGSGPDGALYFRDPSDGRYWELTHPNRSMRGGGPPRLRTVAAEAVPSNAMQPERPTP